MIRTGNESVVKAEINASHNVSAAGDIVTHKEVHSTHTETHIHERESAIGTVIKNMTEGWDRVFYPHKEEVERIHREWREASNSDGSLLAFTAKHISAIEALAASDTMAYHITQARYSTCMQALEVIEQRNASRTEMLVRVATLRQQLAQTMSAQKRRRFLFFGGLFVVPLVCFALLGVMAFSGLGHDAAVRQEVQELIREEKYAEARIRAQDLSGSDPVKRMMEAIDKAEASRKPSGR
jgi:hypothetical protein